MKKIILIICGLALVGCASNGDDTKVAKKNTGYACEKIKITGKLIPKTVCSTTAQREDMEEKGKEGLKNRRIAITGVIMNGQ